MSQILVLVLLVAAVALGWRYASKRSVQPDKPVARRESRPSYHCVEVRVGAPSCEAVQQCTNVRFFPNEAPGLPVTGCNAGTCTCSYVHHEDRREDDRRNPYGQWASMLSVTESERRSKHERRRVQQSVYRPSMAR